MKGQLTQRTYEKVGLKSRNARATSGIRLPGAALVIAVFAVGIIALTAAGPAAALPTGPQLKDDKDMTCPNAVPAYQLIDGTATWLWNPDYAKYDHNGNGAVCYRYLY